MATVFLCYWNNAYLLSLTGVPTRLALPQTGGISGTELLTDGGDSSDDNLAGMRL